MSNNSSPSTPRYGGDEYHRRLAEIPMDNSQNSDQQSPDNLQRNNNVNEIFMYGEMTQSEDSGYSTDQNTQVENRDWNRVFSPPTSPSPPRLSQLEDCERSLTPVQPVLLEEASPNMFPPATPGAYVLRVRNDMFPISNSQSTVSPSMLGLARARSPSEHNMLINGDILNTSAGSVNVQPDASEWSSDGNDEEMFRHMVEFNDEDCNDEMLNHHMDVYECFGGLM